MSLDVSWDHWIGFSSKQQQHKNQIKPNQRNRISVKVRLFFHLCVNVYDTLCVCMWFLHVNVYECVCVWECMMVYVSMCMCLCVNVSVSVCETHVCVSVWLCLCVCVSMSEFIGLSVWGYVCVGVWLCMWVCMCFSLRIHWSRKTFLVMWGLLAKLAHISVDIAVVIPAKINSVYTVNRKQYVIEIQLIMMSQPVMTIPQCCCQCRGLLCPKWHSGLVSSLPWWQWLT